jgi:hypothetical protein
VAVVVILNFIIYKYIKKSFKKFQIKQSQNFTYTRYEFSRENSIYFHHIQAQLKSSLEMIVFFYVYKRKYFSHLTFLCFLLFYAFLLHVFWFIM